MLLICSVDCEISTNELLCVFFITCRRMEIKLSIFTENQDENKESFESIHSCHAYEETGIEGKV